MPHKEINQIVEIKATLIRTLIRLIKFKEQLDYN